MASALFYFSRRTLPSGGDATGAQQTPAPTTVKGATHKEAGAWTLCAPQRRASTVGSQDRLPRTHRHARQIYTV